MTAAPNNPNVPLIDAAELATLETLGIHRTVSAGEYLYREGDAAYDFYVVLSGRVDIFMKADRQERRIASHGPGRFLGELNLLTGLRVFVSARAAELTEVLAVPAEALRQVIATQPRLSDKILAAFISRRADLMTGAASATRVIGSRFSPESLRISEFLSRIRVPHEWLDPDVDPRVDDILKGFGIDASELPVVISSTDMKRPRVKGSRRAASGQ